MKFYSLLPLSIASISILLCETYPVIASPLPQSAYGSGIPLYGLADDLTCTSNVCTSTTWLALLNSHQKATNLKYIYPNYPYINFLAFDDPNNWLAKYPATDIYNSDCNANQTSPIFVDYNVRKTDSSCFIGGTYANTTYRNGSYKIMPQVSMDPGLTGAIETCYNTLTKAKNNKKQINASCQIPCGSGGTNPIFALAQNQCTKGMTTITSLATLDKMMMYTGETIAAMINNDSQADGVAFDIEGPALPDEAAYNFYQGLISRLNPSKYIGIWEGVNVFKNTAYQTSLLTLLSQNNAFLILSMYDIGPDDTPPHGGGLDVGQSPVWYSGFTVPQSTGSSQLSAFELTLFGDFKNNLACHPNSMGLPSPYQSTGFNGCTGSLGFMDRMMNGSTTPLPTGMPFQVGIPAISSTTEWIHTVMWYNVNSFDPSTQEIITSDAAKNWITLLSTTNCPLPISLPAPIKGTINCYVFGLKNDTGFAQSQFINNFQNSDGIVNIINKRASTTAFWGQNFMGFFIYGIKASNFDYRNCQVFFSNPTHQGKPCYGNYPEAPALTQLNNTIPNSVWQAISSYYQQALVKTVAKKK